MQAFHFFLMQILPIKMLLTINRKIRYNVHINIFYLKELTLERLLLQFKALSDRNRLLMLKLLQEGELCGCHIGAALNMVQPQVSFHLRALKKADLIRERKCGRWTYYRLNDSDLHIRFLLLSALERISDADVAEKRRGSKHSAAVKSNPCS